METAVTGRRRLALALILGLLVPLGVVLLRRAFEAAPETTPFLHAGWLVVLAAWLGGLWPGLLATASFLGAVSLLLIFPSEMTMVGFSVVLFQGILLSCFGEARWRAIARWRKVTSEVDAARASAEEANRAKDQFLARLSHELRTPMAPILGISSLLEIDETLPPKFREQMNVVRRNAEVEARLIDNLLNLTGSGLGVEAFLPNGSTAAAAVEPFRPEPVGEGPADRPLHILLVEDHLDTAYAISNLLTRLGHRVTHADSPETALSAAADSPIDFVVSDLGLRSGSGLDLMPELIRRYGLRGIAISGLGGNGAIARSRDAGFSRHLTKPVTFATLRDAIREVATAPV